MRVKWAMLVVVVCVAVAAVAVAYAAGKTTPEMPEVIRAQRFELVDGEGNVSAVLYSSNGQPRLVLSNPRGNSRVAVYLTPVGGASVLELSGESGYSAELTIGRHGNPGLTFMDKDLKERADFGLAPDGSAGIVLCDREAKVVWEAP